MRGLAVDVVFCAGWARALGPERSLRGRGEAPHPSYTKDRPIILKRAIDSLFCGGVAARALGARAANSFGRLTLPHQPVCHHRPDTPEAPNCPYVVAHRLADMCTSPSRSADGSALRRTHVITHIARAHACATYAVRRTHTHTYAHISGNAPNTTAHVTHWGSSNTPTRHTRATPTTYTRHAHGSPARAQ